MTPPSVRPARAEDAAVIASLLGELGYPAGTEQVTLRLASMPDTFITLVAEGEAVAGADAVARADAVAGAEGEAGIDGPAAVDGAAIDGVGAAVGGVGAAVGGVGAAVDGAVQVVGVAVARTSWRLTDDRPVAQLVTLVTSAGRRGYGAGTALVRAVEDWARQHGATRLLVLSGLQRVDAHQWYQRRGFQHTGLRLAKDL